MCNYCWQPENMYASYDDLEMMYPEIYRKIYPLVVKHCNILEIKYGPCYKPAKKELDKICEDIYEKIKDEFDNADEDNKKYEDNFYKRNFLNNLFIIIITTELIQRRRFRRII